MKTSSRSITFLILTAALTALFGAGCRNTVNGVGRDVERAGHNIHKSVN
jgi:predicted small secreted protein